MITIRKDLSGKNTAGLCTKSWVKGKMGRKVREKK